MLTDNSCPALCGRYFPDPLGIVPAVVSYQLSVISSQLSVSSECCRENPPGFQSAKLPVYNHVSTDKKRKIQNPLVGRGFPDAPSGTSPQGSTMLGESVPFTKFDRREGACLLPAGKSVILALLGANPLHFPYSHWIFVIYWCLLPEGASPFPTVNADKLYVLS